MSSRSFIQPSPDLSSAVASGRSGNWLTFAARPVHLGLFLHLPAFLADSFLAGRSAFHPEVNALHERHGPPAEHRVRHEVGIDMQGEEITRIVAEKEEP